MKTTENKKTNIQFFTNVIEKCEMCGKKITKEELENSDICSECLNELN